MVLNLIGHGELTLSKNIVTGIIASLVVISLTGCQSTTGSSLVKSASQFIPIQDPYTYGYREGDPCFRCGESWIFVHKPSEPKPF